MATTFANDKLLKIAYKMGKDELAEYKKNITHPMTDKEEYDWKRGFEKGFILGAFGMFAQLTSDDALKKAGE